jgi:hypothetical protein
MDRERRGMKKLGFNILAILSGILMIVAMFYPWWSIKLTIMGQTNIYPYLVDGPLSQLVGYKRSPQMTILTGLLFACILLCLIGGFLKGKSGRVMLIVSGVLTFLAAWRFAARMADVAGRFDLSIQGYGRGSFGGFAKVEVWTWLQPGIYLIIIAGVLAIIASLLEPKLNYKH